jgi:GH15 family glucan-1,4-alpha-glucosidase
MKKIFVLIFLITILYNPDLCSKELSNKIEPSYFKLTTSNGLIVAVYDTKKAEVEYVFPHIFANYDSALYVKPFIGNIRLNSPAVPQQACYLDNSHVISVKYNDFIVYYFSSFTNSNKVFYIVIRGEKEKIENLSFNTETGNGKLLTGISLLTYSHNDLTVHLAGNAYSGTLLRPYNNNIYEKYFLYSFTDSLHTDSSVISKAIKQLELNDKSLLDSEVSYMQNVFARCKIPADIPAKERNLIEQSVSVLKMAQVADKEIFPLSHGQILASLRPGLWHVAWVRDGSYAIQAMTHLGLYEEARKGLEFFLNARVGNYKHYILKDGKDYGVGSDYQVSVCRYFGNGREESTYVDGPNIEFDNFGLFLIAFADYVANSKDSAFYRKWNKTVCKKIADVIISCIDTNLLIRDDSGPWEHYLQMPRQYAFTSGVCAKGLEQFAMLQKQYNLPFEKYKTSAETLKQGIFTHLLIDGKYIKGNVNDQLKTDHEYYDAGVYELFANRYINDKELFLSHMSEYDTSLRIKSERPGYIRLSSADPYETQEWVFIDLRIALAYLLFGQKDEAEKLINYVTEQASVNFNLIPEMYSNKLQLDKMTDNFNSYEVWCNCIRDKDDLYIGAIPMVGYGAGAYILTLLTYYSGME